MVGSNQPEARLRFEQATPEELAVILPAVKDLTREAIFEAVRARHTFGTSGAKMSLFFNVGGILMGDKVRRPNGPVTFHVQARASRDIKEVVIFRNNEIVFRQEPGRKEVEANWTDPQPPAAKHVWYYARIQATDGELAWSSPIWFSENPLQRWQIQIPK